MTNQSDKELLTVLMTAPNRMTEAIINDKSVTYFEVHDSDALLDLIKSQRQSLAKEILDSVTKLSPKMIDHGNDLYNAEATEFRNGFNLAKGIIEALVKEKANL